MIFALDVGTRTVIGMILEDRDKNLHIIASHLEEHQSRAMLDGQIQDIPEVVKIVQKVKSKLEKKTGRTLNTVSVAAAGRALKTTEAKISKKCNPSVAITKDVISALELEGLYKAQQKIGDDFFNKDYYCVGYSIKKYFLDEFPVENLEGQFGKIIEVELVATFLPRGVVDSLYSVLTQCDLKIETLTLEPIAASQIIIEPGMRKLNLALVDIGAGTSDIAISKDGSIVAFGMVPYAGDEITESISELLLVDFATAEKIKRKLNSEEMVKFNNILGDSCQKKVGDIINSDKFNKSIEELAKKISKEIFRLNGNSPSAVLCIGGGSQTPKLRKFLAQYLNLTIERVAIRDRSAVKQIKGLPKKVNGPEFITPFGIAFAQSQEKGITLQFVDVNDKRVRLFGKDKLKVLDVLYAAGIPSKDIYGKLGPGISLEVNGELKFYPGEKGIPASITINEKLASLEDYVKQGDRIKFLPAVQGKAPVITLADIIQNNVEKEFYVNGEKIKFIPHFIVNNKPAALSLKLEDNDSISWEEILTVKDLLQYCKYENLNDEIIKVKVNGKQASLNSEVKNGDRIDLSIEEKRVYVKKIKVFVNEKEVFLQDRPNLILSDIFSTYNFSTVPPSGKKKLIIMLNGKNATFISPLKDGDDVKLVWK